MKEDLRKDNSDFNTRKLEEQNQHCKKLTNDDFNIYVNEHICDKLAQGNPKPLYNFINNKRGQNNTIKNIDGTSGDQGIAESFVEAFTSVFTVDDNTLPTPVSPKHLQTDKFRIDENGVFSLLNELDLIISRQHS